MEGNIPNEFVDEVRSRFDIVDLVAEYVQLKRSGRNHFGLCPFHGEKTPSFSVSQDKQIFHCFGCGEGGNVFSFLMKMDGLTFPDAVKELAERAGLALPQMAEDPGRQRAQSVNKRLRSCLDWAYKYYVHMLGRPDAAEAARYLENRGLTPEITKQFGIGFAPDSWDAIRKFIKSKGYSDQEMIQAGLLTSNEGKTYDKFRNRIIFPIHNQRGEIIAFGGRVLGEGMPKYLNSPETPLFDKGKNLYALHLSRESIRKRKQAVIFEGYMDVIAAHQAGVTQAVASLGTSLTEAQARLLRNQADDVVIVYDADAAGQAATWRGLGILRQAGCLVKVGRLPNGLDPDDYIRKFGGDAFQREIVDQALLLVDYQLASLKDQYNLGKADDRIRFFDKVCDVLLAVENAMERDDYLVKAAAMLDVSANAIREELKKKGRKNPGRTRIQPVVTGTTPERSSAAEKAPLQILTLWARFPALIAASFSELEAEDFPEELHYVYLAAQKDGTAFSPARLLDLFHDEKHRQTFSRMLIHEEDYEEKIARKAVDDCVRLLKCVRIARRRKELEAQMAKLDPDASKGEIGELSKVWLELRKLEEAINNPTEGGKGFG